MSGADVADQMAPVTAGIACVAGGMLLYSSLVSLVADDMKRPVALRVPCIPVCVAVAGACGVMTWLLACAAASMWYHTRCAN